MLLCAAGFGAGLGWALRGPIAHPANALDAPKAPSDRHTVIVDVAREISPAVVAITTAVPNRSLAAMMLSRRDESVTPYVGSGFLVERSDLLAAGQKDVIGDEKSRYVLTNYHVIREASRVSITLPDGRSFATELLDADPIVDVAMLRVLDSEGEDLPTVKVAKPDDIMIGEGVVAFGNPFGSLIDDPHPSVTVGVVSATNRSFEPQEDLRFRSRRSYYRNMIQTDASVNPGNSGGPLTNFDGDVIGINTFIIAPGGGSSGVNFAIPVSRALKVAQEILQHGKVRSLAQDFDVIAIDGYVRRQLRLRESQGLVVNWIAEIGSAVEANLAVGDVIVTVDGKALRRPDDLWNYMLSLTPGEKVKLGVSRDGRVTEIDYLIRAARGDRDDPR
jgi:S1-C subfamily serine protease